MQIAYKWKRSISEEKGRGDRKVIKNGQERNQEKYHRNITTEKGAGW
jgi:hypothetical protein